MVGGARLGRRLAADPTVHRVRRPVTPDGGQSFDLAYVRTGPRNGRPLLIVPGGPGLASVLPYRALREDAARDGLDVVMVEHRGVGLSRGDDQGADLPPSAFTVEQVVEDLAAVLDDCDAASAVVYGSSYGSYVAQGFGVRHPDRVSGMVLDSVMMSAHDDEVVRATLRELYRDGARPETARAARLLREALAAGQVEVDTTGAVTQIVHEFAGPEAVERLLELRRSGRGRWLWERLSSLGMEELTARQPFAFEADLVMVIAFAELGYAPRPDGLPLDVNLSFLPAAKQYPDFAGEPYDLARELPGFTWPTAVVSGDRDLRTPRRIAERVADLVPDAVVVPLAATGHSALDTHRQAALQVARAVRDGSHRDLPGLAPALSALPRRGASRLVGHGISAGIRLAGLLPRSRPQPGVGEEA